MTALNGDVVDLSASGVKIRLPGKPDYEAGDRCTLLIKTPTQTLRMDARIAWIRREGLLKPTWHAGLNFLDTRPAVRKMVETLAVTGYADPKSAKSAPDPVSAGASGSTRSSSGHAPQASATIEPPNLYEILGVPENATQDQIKAVYLDSVRRYHPDTNGDQADVERFTMISKAYAVLRDPDLRKRYDDRYRAAA